MNVNKKLDRFKQWAGERMGGEVKTNTTDDFKALEMEMQLRHEGMDRLQRSMTMYMKSLSKRSEGEDKEKALPVAYLGSTMVGHGEEFEPDSEFGNCLINFGRANERIARIQETYIATSTTTWLESLERSLVQLKEYQASRKKLEQRRLAYDTSLTKMQKQKKEDFRVEEELRAQKAKYEESSEDVMRRIMDIKEAEAETVADLTQFLEAELSYYDKCRDVLLQLKREWPVATAPITVEAPTPRRGTGRSRSNTAHSFSERFSIREEEPPMPPEPRMKIGSNRLPSGASSPRRELPGYELPLRPASQRSATFEGPTKISREGSPAGMPRLTRVPTEPSVLLSNRAQLRPVRRAQDSDVFSDPEDPSSYRDGADNDRYYERSVSPATSHGSNPSRTTSWTNMDQGGQKKAPPPPPPSRSKKPPPPPPMKRSALSTSDIPHTQ